MKHPPKMYRGIEYCVVTDLPSEQQELIKNSGIEFIKILQENGVLIDKCIQYKDYSAWFDKIYSAQRNTEEAKQSVPQNTDVRIAFNN